MRGREGEGGRGKGILPFYRQVHNLAILLPLYF